MTEIRNSILAGIAFGLFFGTFIAVLFSISYALIIGGILGLAFGISIYFFVTSETVKQNTQIQADCENVIHSGGANHFLNGEAVGGKLYLLTDKLQFQSHGFNVQDHGQTIDLNKIKEINFFNIHRLIPNGLAITTLDGQTEKFVVSGRRLWKEKIEKLLIRETLQS